MLHSGPGRIVSATDPRRRQKSACDATHVGDGAAHPHFSRYDAEEALDGMYHRAVDGQRLRREIIPRKTQFQEF
jgi:hypothetical protein